MKIKIILTMLIVVLSFSVRAQQKDCAERVIVFISHTDPEIDFRSAPERGFIFKNLSRSIRKKKSIDPFLTYWVVSGDLCSFVAKDENNSYPYGVAVFVRSKKTKTVSLTREEVLRIISSGKSHMYTPQNNEFYQRNIP